MMLSNISTLFVFFLLLSNTSSFLLPHTSFSPYLPSFFFFWSLTSLLLAGQGIAPSLMAPLSKRAALEKANGATAMFNTGMLQYQQALANMQFQQQAAFLPSGMTTKATTPRMPGLVKPGSCLSRAKWLNDKKGLIVDWSTLNYRQYRLSKHLVDFFLSQSAVEKVQQILCALCFVWHCMAYRC